MEEIHSHLLQQLDTKLATQCDNITYCVIQWKHFFSCHWCMYLERFSGFTFGHYLITVSACI